MGNMFFGILATFAEFEVDLLRMRTREGMAVARAKDKLRGKQPKLSARQQRELARMPGTGEYTIADLAEVFTVSRATVYRTLQRSPGSRRGQVTGSAATSRLEQPQGFRDLHSQSATATSCAVLTRIPRKPATAPAAAHGPGLLGDAGHDLP